MLGQHCQGTFKDSLLALVLKQTKLPCPNVGKQFCCKYCCYEKHTFASTGIMFAQDDKVVMRNTTLLMLTQRGHGTVQSSQYSHPNQKLDQCQFATGLCCPIRKGFTRTYSMYTILYNVILICDRENPETDLFVRGNSSGVSLCVFLAVPAESWTRCCFCPETRLILRPQSSCPDCLHS